MASVSFRGQMWLPLIPAIVGGVATIGGHSYSGNSSQAGHGSEPVCIHAAARHPGLSYSVSGDCAVRGRLPRSGQAPCPAG